MNMDQIGAWLLDGETTVSAEITSPGFFLQVGIILVGAGIAFAILTAIRSRYSTTSLAMGWPGPVRLLVRVLVDSAPIALFAVLMVLTRAVMMAAALPSRSYLLPVAAKLAVAWLVIRLATSVIRNQFLVRTVSVLSWCVAALSILGLLQPVIDALDSVAIVIGGLRLSPLLLIKATVLLAIALWVSNFIGHFLDSRISRSHDLTPSMQVLLIKLIRVSLMVAAVVEHMKAEGVKTVGYIGFSDALGDLVYSSLEKAAGPAGIRIVANERYSRSDTSIAGQVLKLVAAHPDAILAGNSGSPGALPYLGLAQRGYKGRLYGTHGLINADFVRVAGASADQDGASSLGKKVPGTVVGCLGGSGRTNRPWHRHLLKARSESAKCLQVV